MEVLPEAGPGEIVGLLEFVDTPKRAVVLEPTGHRFLKAASNDRASLWREQMLKLQLVHDVPEMLRRREDGYLDRSVVEEAIVMQLPQADYERVFKTMVRWARYANLFDYDEATGRLRAAS